MDDSRLPSLCLAQNRQPTSQEKFKFNLPQPKASSNIGQTVRTPSPHHTPIEERNAKRREKLLKRFAEDDLYSPSSTGIRSADSSTPSHTPHRSAGKATRSRNIFFDSDIESEANTSADDSSVQPCSFDLLSSVDEIDPAMPESQHFLSPSQRSAREQLDKLDWRDTSKKNEIARLSKRVRGESPKHLSPKRERIGKIPAETIPDSPERQCEPMESDGFSDDDDFMEGLGGMIQRETGKPDIKPEVKKKPDGKTEVTKQPNPIKPDFDDDFSDDDFFADAFESATQKQRVDPPPNTSKQNGANKQVNKQSTPARDVKPTNGTMKEDDDDDWGDDSFFMDALQSQIK